MNSGQSYSSTLSRDDTITDSVTTLLDTDRSIPGDVGGQPDYSILYNLCAELKTLKSDKAASFLFEDEVVPADRPDGAGPVSQSLDTIDFEIFKITEMARRWIVENGLSPYKLALITGTSPSQVHRIMEPGWTPSLKLARKIASSLPAEWVAEFERDCNACLPRLFYLQPSPFTKSGPINQLVQSIGSNAVDQVLADLTANQFSFRQYEQISREEATIFTARHTESGIQESGYAPPPPRLLWTPGSRDAECHNCTFWIHRTPIKVGEQTNLYTIHIAEFEGKNSATQFWKIETFKDLSNPRQLDILEAYHMAEGT